MLENRRMQHQHGAVAEHEQQEQASACRTSWPRSSATYTASIAINANVCPMLLTPNTKALPSVRQNEFEPRLQRPHPFETDQPYDRQREFRNQQRLSAARSTSRRTARRSCEAGRRLPGLPVRFKDTTGSGLWETSPASPKNPVSEETGRGRHLAQPVLPVPTGRRRL